MRAVNLIPSEQRPGAGGTYGRSGGVAYALVGLATGLVAMSVMWLMARHDVNTQNAKVTQLGQQAQQAQAVANGLTSYNSFVTMSTGRVSAVEQLAQDRFDWAHAFHELGRVLPANVSLSLVTGTIATGTTATPAAAPPPGAAGAATGATGAAGAAGATPASVTPAGSVPTLVLQGCTFSQSDVAFTLQRLALIDGVTNVTLQSSTAGAQGGSSPASSACPDSFNVTVTFTALPTVTPTAATGAAPPPGVGTPASSATVASTSAAGASATPASAASTPSTTGAATPSATSASGPSSASGATGASGASGATGATGGSTTRPKSPAGVQ